MLTLTALALKAPLSKSPAVTRRFVHGLPQHGLLGRVQASGASTFNTIIDKTIHGCVDVRDEFAREMAARHSACKFIDVGCGTGGLTRQLNKRLDRRCTVVGVDSSRPMIEQAKRESRNTPFLESSAVDIIGTYDVAVAAFMFHELPTTAAREVLAHLMTHADDVYVLDVSPESLGDSYVLRLFEPFIADFKRNWTSVVKQFGGARVHVNTHPSTITVWHFQRNSS